VSSATSETRIPLSAPYSVAAVLVAKETPAQPQVATGIPRNSAPPAERSRSSARRGAGAAVGALDVRAIGHRSSGRAVNQRRVKDRAAEPRGHGLSRAARNEFADGVEEFLVDAAVEGHEPFTYW